MSLSVTNPLPACTVPLPQILANCATLAMYSQEPGFHALQLGHALEYTDWVFAACFSLEMLLKIIAMGLICRPGTYLRDGEWQTA
jgi:hypothetical protein